MNSRRVSIRLPVFNAMNGYRRWRIALNLKPYYPALFECSSEDLEDSSPFVAGNVQCDL
jgi:hypothetical protein